MQNLGKHLVRAHVTHLVGGEHDQTQDSLHEANQVVYRRNDGTYFINFMGSKREVVPVQDGIFEYTQTISHGRSAGTLEDLIDELSPRPSGMRL